MLSVLDEVLVVDSSVVGFSLDVVVSSVVVDVLSSLNVVVVGFSLDVVEVNSSEVVVVFMISILFERVLEAELKVVVEVVVGSVVVEVDAVVVVFLVFLKAENTSSFF